MGEREINRERDRQNEDIERENKRDPDRQTDKQGKTEVSEKGVLHKRKVLLQQKY